jgi:nitrite reductase/ring-hydroxylating ferredoxin subunit
MSDRRVERRTVLRGVAATGAVLATAPVLASCGSSSGGGGGGGSVTVKTTDVPVGGGVVDQAGGVVVVQPTAGAFKAYSAICPHQGCTVGQISGGFIVCPCHGSTFKVSDGSVVQGPAAQGLTPMVATVQGGDVVVSG